jgi:hypothetical protein
MQEKGTQAVNTYFNELLQVLIRYAEDGNSDLLLRDLEIIDHEKRGFDANIERQWIDLEAKKAVAGQ